MGLSIMARRMGMVCRRRCLADELKERGNFKNSGVPCQGSIIFTNKCVFYVVIGAGMQFKSVEKKDVLFFKSRPCESACDSI